MPDSRTCGPAAHQIGPAPSHTAVGVQSNDWPDGTIEARNRAADIMTPLFQACSDHAIAACRRHRTKSRTLRLTLFEQVEMDRGTCAEERTIGFAELATHMPAPAVCEDRALLLEIGEATGRE